MHSFHIPVMGIGFTIDTPLKVSQYGIDSSISLVDDILIERLRKMYCEKNELEYTEISKHEPDHRAKRITAYLNLLQDLSNKQFALKYGNGKNSIESAKAYFEMQPDSDPAKKEFQKLIQSNTSDSMLNAWLKDNLKPGSIDVNIMTKVDKDNYIGQEKQAIEYNDAHAAVRGYANSNLESSLILSAGMNPRLYSYIEKFDDFYPDANGTIKKKIILKVSDFRSAKIQANFLAKKGIWVSEFRIESGLNCGGHAFATEGHLLGPILAQFRDERKQMLESIIPVMSNSLESKNRVVPQIWPVTKLTAQGGVGTAEEHSFMLEHYQLDSVGWGSPFLLVPEATTVDSKTREKLENANEDDIYLSAISPLGVPFQNLRSNSKDLEKMNKIQQGRPGSKCPKRFVALNKEFSEKGMCTASREYQRLKTKELHDQNLPKEEYDRQFNQIVNKSCTCVGLGTSALLAYGLDTKVEGDGVAVCPGPNLAYFDKTMKLGEITDHIYGRINVIRRADRPNMYIKELRMYIDVFQDKIRGVKSSADEKLKKQVLAFSKNLNNGVKYYMDLFSKTNDRFVESRANVLAELARIEYHLFGLQAQLVQD